MLRNCGNGDMQSKEFAIFLHGMRVKKSRWYQSYFFIKMLEIGSTQPVLDDCRTEVPLQRKNIKCLTIGKLICHAHDLRLSLQALEGLQGREA